LDLKMTSIRAGVLSMSAAVINLMEKK